jgi:uroporphyrinogen-III synthase
VGEGRGNALQGKRVVVTRAAEQSESLVEALKGRGAIPVVVPIVAFALPDDLAALHAAIKNIPRFDWIFLTSQNALRAILEQCAPLRLDPREAFSGVRIATVGPTTAEAVEKAGLDVAYVASKHEGVALAEELEKEVRRKKVLLPRSDRANPALVEKLKEFGAEVREVCAYKTVKPEANAMSKVADVLGNGAEAVLFFSPSAVHHLRELLGDGKFVELSGQVVFAAIGPVTEGALRKAKVQRVLQARDTSVSAIVETLTDYFARQGADVSTGAKPA